MMRWLRCAVKKGMFSDERLISITGMTFFVHKDQVQGDIDHQGKVRVELLKKDNQFWAILPTEDTAIVEVNSDDLEAVGA
ncbi:MAG: hypothetical protein EHM48_07235 [Planctomycetaceae bacterium]|nr:MAG: hypothetical protein EHM48_07235 [Planctomycetaceae bacterium]